MRTWMILTVASGLLVVSGCATEQVYFTKPGEWDPAKLARDEAECETLAMDSASYRRAYRNPFMTMFARNILIEQTRECLIREHGWQETKTVQPPTARASR